MKMATAIYLIGLLFTLGYIEAAAKDSEQEVSPMAKVFSAIMWPRTWGVIAYSQKGSGHDR